MSGGVPWARAHLLGRFVDQLAHGAQLLVGDVGLGELVDLADESDHRRRRRAARRRARVEGAELAVLEVAQSLGRVERHQRTAVLVNDEAGSARESGARRPSPISRHLCAQHAVGARNQSDRTSDLSIGQPPAHSERTRAPQDVRWKKQRRAEARVRVKERELQLQIQATEESPRT